MKSKPTGRLALLLSVHLLLSSSVAQAQQFYSDNQWVAPHPCADPELIMKDWKICRMP